MTIDPAVIFRFLAIRPTGDLGPVTFYTTRRGRLVVYPSSPARKPPSRWQIIMRDLWTSAARAWTELTPTARQRWEALAHTCGLRITGYNLWIHYSTKPLAQTIPTLLHQANTDLPTLFDAPP